MRPHRGIRAAALAELGLSHPCACAKTNNKSIEGEDPVRAIVFHEFGPPNVLRLEDVPTPEPGPGEVLLKVHGVSVNRTLDLVVRSGLYARRPPLPHVLGVDPCGVVTSVGPDVTGRKVGDRVVCGPIIGVDPNGAPWLLGVNAWGGYAEYVKVPAAKWQQMLAERQEAARRIVLLATQVAALRAENEALKSQLKKGNGR